MRRMPSPTLPVHVAALDAKSAEPSTTMPLPLLLSAAVRVTQAESLVSNMSPAPSLP